MHNSNKKRIIYILLIILSILFLFSYSYVKGKGLKYKDIFTDSYCKIGNIFSDEDLCNMKPNISEAHIVTNINKDTLSDQIASLQTQINTLKSRETIIYSSPINNEKIVYIQGPKGDKGDKGDTSEINVNNNTNWSSVWTPSSQYQYVPVAGSNGAQGSSGSNGKDGNYITQITQDATNTTYYLYDPNTNSTTSVLVANATQSVSTSTIIDILNTNSWSTIGNANTDPNINFIGTTDSQPLIFKVNNIENIRIATNGFVGMGTNNPLAELHLAKSISGGYDIRSDSFGQQGTFMINRSSGTVANPTTPSSGGILGTIGFGAWNSGSTNFTDTAFMRGLIEKSSGANDLPTALTFWTTADSTSTPIERFRITNDGRLGQNITSPLANFQSINTQNISSVYFDRYGGTADIVLRTTGGTFAAPTAVTTNQRLGRLAVQGYNGSNFSNNRASIEFLAREDWTTGANATAIDFSTTNIGTNILSTKMRIDENGYVGIGTINPEGLLHIEGQNSNGNYMLFGGDSISSYNYFNVSTNGESDGFGHANMGINPEEKFSINMQNLSGSYHNNFYFSEEQINLYNQLGTYFYNDANSYGAQLIRFGDADWNYNGTRMTINDADRVINIGNNESDMNDGIEGIQISYDNSNSPFIKIGSTGYYGNNTLFTIDDINNKFLFENGSFEVNDFLIEKGIDLIGGQGSSLSITNSNRNKNIFFKDTFTNTMAAISELGGSEFDIYLKDLNTGFVTNAINMNYDGENEYSSGQDRILGSVTGPRHVFYIDNNEVGGFDYRGWFSIGSNHTSNHNALAELDVTGNAFISGKIGIAVTNPVYNLDVGNSSVGGIVAQFTNSTGYCTINPTNTSLSCTSDMNLKKNITNISDNSIFSLNQISISSEDTYLSKLIKLNPVFYNWNTENDTEIKHSGFIAQEVEQIFPDLVTTNIDTNLKSVNYTGFTVYTIQAIKELNLKIDTGLVDGFDYQDDSEIDVYMADIIMESPRIAAEYIKEKLKLGKIAINDFIVNRITAINAYFDNLFVRKATISELCLKDEVGISCYSRAQLDSILINKDSEILHGEIPEDVVVNTEVVNIEENTDEDIVEEIDLNIEEDNLDVDL